MDTNKYHGLEESNFRVGKYNDLPFGDTVLDRPGFLIEFLCNFFKPVTSICSIGEDDSNPHISLFPWSIRGQAQK